MTEERMPGVKRLQKEHLPEVAELEKICFAEPWSEKSLGMLLTESGAGVVCIGEKSGADTGADTGTDTGKVIGYGGMILVPQEGQITNIAVHPEARRRGAGKKILGALIELAQEAGAEQVSLEVRVSNTAAIRMYLQAGFEEAGRRKRFYRSPAEDALVMIRKLPAGKD